LEISVVNRELIGSRSGADRGFDGHHPYMDINCCRLQQTTRMKNGAHSAHSPDHIEAERLVVGSVKIRTVPKGAQAQNESLDSSWTPRTTFLIGRGTVSV
jgi:hypothetical protein